MATPDGRLLKVRQILQGREKRYFAETLVSVICEDGSEKMVRAMFDSGCSKSIILKEFTAKKRRTKLSKEDQVQYETYGGNFVSKSTGSVKFKLCEFQNHQDVTVEHQFQVDELQKSKKV